VQDATVTAILQKLAAVGPGAELRLSGHSMGASMAQLCAATLFTDHGIVSTSVYTFGTPRLGNDKFMSWFAGSGAATSFYRVTHYKDPIPHFPPMHFGYRHGPTEVYYNDQCTEHKVCDSSGEDDSCMGQFETYQCLTKSGVEDHLHYLNATFGQSQCQ
jgi:hypothetical protein